MVLSFDDIELAFEFVSSDQPMMHEAYISRETGEIFYFSEMNEIEGHELPEDVDDPEKYVYIPHKNELDLGKELVFEFTRQSMPEKLRTVEDIFHRRGAYSRFKDLLERENQLEAWYKYEEDEISRVLREWCSENEIELKD